MHVTHMHRYSWIRSQLERSMQTLQIHVVIMQTSLKPSILHICIHNVSYPDTLCTRQIWTDWTVIMHTRRSLSLNEDKKSHLSTNPSRCLLNTCRWYTRFTAAELTQHITQHSTAYMHIWVERFWRMQCAVQTWKMQSYRKIRTTAGVWECMYPYLHTCFRLCCDTLCSITRIGPDSRSPYRHREN